jgi:hypothetical protein
MAGRHSDFMLYTVSDFDITGQSIHHTLTNDTGRYQFRNKVHNKHLGVTWEQAQKLHAEGRSEPVAVASVKATSADLLLERGLDPDAVEFLTGLKPRRVEVNALRPAQFLEMIRKGIGSPRKLIPPDPVLADAYQELTIQHRLRALEAELRDGDAPDVPDGLMVDVIDELGGNPDQSWDQAILRIIEGGIQ